MTTKTLTIDFTIGDHFMAYIAYGETDHLETEEVEIFEAFEAGARALPKNGYEFMHWSISDNRDEFAKCEATGLMGACTEVQAVYRRIA